MKDLLGWDENVVPLINNGGNPTALVIDNFIGFVDSIDMCLSSDRKMLRVLVHSIELAVSAREKHKCTSLGLNPQYFRKNYSAPNN